MELLPGIYEVTSDISIRREPRIVEYIDPGTKKLVTNQTGKITVGTQRAVYSVQVQKDNSTWGRLSQSDSAGIAEWVCIQNVNRTFMKFLEPLKDHAREDQLERIEAKLDQLLEMVKAR